MTISSENISALKELFDSSFNAAVTKKYPLEDSFHPAVRYALNAGGKRVRPLMCLLAADALGGDVNLALDPAFALEMVHTYSLVHDDLPCMDNDDLRRGKPTTHKVYGEATALLVGDALLTDAFTILSENPQCERACLMVRELARAAGGAQNGMVWGQSQDLYWTGRANASAEDLIGIHRGKTGALLGASTALGALTVTVDPKVITAFREFGQAIGLVFQIIDDLLDDSAATGKSQGKDRESNKLTYLTLLGATGARREAERLTVEAKEKILKITDNTTTLFAYTDSLLVRMT